MKLILFDRPEARTSLLPLTFTRSIADLRIGILTIREKWQYYSGLEVEVLTEPYLKPLYPGGLAGDCLLIDSTVLPDTMLWSTIEGLEPGEALVWEGQIIAVRSVIEPISYPLSPSFEKEISIDSTNQISHSWHLFTKNGAEIGKDFLLLSEGKTSLQIQDPNTIVYNVDNIFLEEGVQITAAILNAQEGPIYLGKDVVVSEGAIIKGPFGACEGTVVNMGAKIRQNTSAGPHCRLGGEIKESVFQGYCNKSHEGFVGNSVIGEWCNLGADTNTSNLKNTYQSVKLWDFQQQRFIDSGEQYLGLIMGDHAKAGINSMFNTGTVVGIGSNLFGAGYHRNFIPSFAWGGATKSYMTFKLNKFFEVADAVMSRRGMKMSDEERQVYQHIYDMTADYRFWER